MQKIVSLFARNYDGDRLVRNEVVPGAEWVLAGEGKATRKWDGTCCLVRDGKLYKRYEVKSGKNPPPNFEPANEVDDATGKQQGWVPVREIPDDRWHCEALAHARLGAFDQHYYGCLLHQTGHFRGELLNGTYELCGPKINGNPENIEHHQFVLHGIHILEAPRDFDGIREFLKTADVEGIVWHHPDGRMVKIKAKDFGIKRSKPRDLATSAFR